MLLLTFLLINASLPKVPCEVQVHRQKCLFLLAFSSSALTPQLVGLASSLEVDLCVNLYGRVAFSDWPADLPLSDCSQFRLRRWVGGAARAAAADVTRPAGGFHT